MTGITNVSGDEIIQVASTSMPAVFFLQNTTLVVEFTRKHQKALLNNQKYELQTDQKNSVRG